MATTANISDESILLTNAKNRKWNDIEERAGSVSSDGEAQWWENTLYHKKMKILYIRHNKISLSYVWERQLRGIVRKSEWVWEQLRDVEDWKKNDIYIIHTVLNLHYLYIFQNNEIWLSSTWI